MIEARRRMRAAGDAGFTLIELLIAIVVVGILAAVVILGINGLRDSGETAACEASLDAARTASVMYYANNNTYPTTIGAMTTATPPLLELPDNPATPPGLTYSTNGWTLTMTPATGTAGPTFACT